jgi:hypothetical protein
MIIVNQPTSVIRAAVSGSSPVTYNSITGVIGLNQANVDQGDDDHTQYQLEVEKGVANGYGYHQSKRRDPRFGYELD